MIVKMSRSVSWLVWGAVGVEGTAQECGNDPYLSQEGCEDWTYLAGGVGLILVMVIWFIGFVPLSLIWLMTKPK